MQDKDLIEKKLKTSVQVKASIICDHRKVRVLTYEFNKEARTFTCNDVVMPPAIVNFHPEFSTMSKLSHSVDLKFQNQTSQCKRLKFSNEPK